MIYILPDYKYLYKCIILFFFNFLNNLSGLLISSAISALNYSWEFCFTRLSFMGVRCDLINNILKFLNEIIICLVNVIIVLVIWKVWFIQFLFKKSNRVMLERTERCLLTRSSLSSRSSPRAAYQLVMRQSDIYNSWLSDSFGKGC